MTYYKATRLDGTDFHTGTIDYGAAAGTGKIVKMAGAGRMRRDDPSTYFSVSTEPGEVLTGGWWPCRLFTVEPAGAVVRSKHFEWKRGCRKLRVIAELPAHEALGPNGTAIAELITRASQLTPEELLALADAEKQAGRMTGDRTLELITARMKVAEAILEASRRAAGEAAVNAVMAAVDEAGRNAVVNHVSAAGVAAFTVAVIPAWDAAQALIARDLLTEDEFGILHDRWAGVIHG